MKSNIRKHKVALIMGSETDYPVMSHAEDCLREMGIDVHVEVVSAHRTPEKMVEFAKNAHEEFSVVIAGAGGAAHLPGMVASLTVLPVIGVPVNIPPLSGLDSLLSIVQMPKGIPVATVAVDNATNAGLLAARICGLSDDKVRQKLVAFQEAQKARVEEMNKKIKRRKKS